MNKITILCDVLAANSNQQNDSLEFHIFDIDSANRVAMTIDMLCLSTAGHVSVDRDTIVVPTKYGAIIIIYYHIDDIIAELQDTFYGTEVTGQVSTPMGD